MENCYYFNNCNHIDCKNNFCKKKFILDKLYENANLSNKYKKEVALYPGKVDLEAFTNLKEIRNNIVDFVKEGKNLYIYSIKCGNGKTQWSIKLLQAYFDSIWASSSGECKALFIKVSDLLQELKNNISNDSEYVKHINENIYKADIVVWDDIGTKGLSTFEHENLFRMIDKRISLGKSNIYTSNLTYQELMETLDSRLYSRIKNYSINIEFKGEDKRGFVKGGNK